MGVRTYLGEYSSREDQQGWKKVLEQVLQVYTCPGQPWSQCQHTHGHGSQAWQELPETQATSDLNYIRIPGSGPRHKFCYHYLSIPQVVPMGSQA